MHRKTLTLTLVSVFVAVSVFNPGRRPEPAAAAPQAGSDLYMKDTPADTGVEPNPDAGPMWVTEDIWVRNVPDPAYQPFPFAEASPPWTPQPHENPEYRDPKLSTPSYVYVRVRNRGTVATNATQWLRLYWTKASTGLGWPAQWVDYMASNCGPTKLYGAEVTKPRKNAATATLAERDAYRQAILSIGTNPALVFGTTSYWHKQDQVHQTGPSNRHGTDAFLPWHREYINRYEVLLQEADPTVKLLYWDWTTDPTNSTGGFNFFTSSFMGASGAGTGGGVSIGLPFLPPLNPPAVIRRLNAGAPPAPSDATVLGNGLYPAFGDFIEDFPHNDSHVYIGGSTGFSGIGDMSFVSSAAEDPFFFLLHGNVDRLWARWQRDPAQLGRLDPGSVYGLASPVNITTNMAPWDSTTGLFPWTAAGGQIAVKAPTHHSVVSPPVYDTAPLTIPALQPGEAVVIQIPWHPPNPNDFACFGADSGHFCLLARIETSTTSPFGMTTLETTDVNANTRNNNNIVWKNITVVDNFAGAAFISSVLVRNIFRERVATGLVFTPARGTDAAFFERGRVHVTLPPDLFKRWREGGARAEGVEAVDRNTIRLTSPKAALQNIILGPEESFSVGVRFEPPKDYQAREGTRAAFDLIQVGAPRDPHAVVGGQRFEVVTDKLPLITEGRDWRYLSAPGGPGANWAAPDFDDSKWRTGKAELGFGDEPETHVDGGPPLRRHITTYFRKTFDVADPGSFRALLLRLKRDDGAVVYLNGKEVHRVNLHRGAVTPGTRATREVSGLEEEVFFPTRVSPEHLRPGRNVVAVEVHQYSPASDDLSFDLELSANPATQRSAPDVRFASPTDGSLWEVGQVIPVTVEALDGDGDLASVSLYADGKLIGTDERAPFSFNWRGAALGRHRLRAVATDRDGQRGTAYLTLNVVKNVPPVVTLAGPSDRASFSEGQAIVVTARARDFGEKVERVEFRVREAEFFGSRERVVGTAKAPPYTVTIRGLAPGHYMVTAVAFDARGQSGESMPIHIEVRGPGQHVGPQH